MKCAICKNGDTSLGFTTVTLQRGDTTIIIKQVPAEICENCGEYYLNDATTKIVFDLAEQSILHGAEVEILKYVA